MKSIFAIYFIVLIIYLQCNYYYILGDKIIVVETV